MQDFLFCKKNSEIVLNFYVMLHIIVSCGVVIAAYLVDFLCRLPSDLRVHQPVVCHSSGSGCSWNLQNWILTV